MEQAKKYRHFKKLLSNKIQSLAQNPYTAAKSELLVGELKGLRSARLTKSFRIIFSICEECRTRKFQNLVGCSPLICKKLGSNTIVFITLGSHDEVYS